VRLILENSTVCLIVDELVCFAPLTVLVVLPFGVVVLGWLMVSLTMILTICQFRFLSGDVALFFLVLAFGLGWGFVFRWRV
jgi:hypothetical protein